MKFLWTTIHVKNLEESIAFYSDLLGLHVVRRFQAGQHGEIAFMGNGAEGETLVELIYDDGCQISHSEFLSIGFAVDSVEKMMKTVKKKNIAVYGEPVENPGSIFFFVKDPNGVIIQLFQAK